MLTPHTGDSWGQADGLCLFVGHLFTVDEEHAMLRIRATLHEKSIAKGVSSNGETRTW
ncbi:MAG: hypothetical protein IMW89_14130 [Ktedonobacteraceae bacterium]|nr:hypothetical protein [Ktedonobacteraceae bacterium]